MKRGLATVMSAGISVEWREHTIKAASALPVTRRKRYIYATSSVFPHQVPLYAFFSFLLQAIELGQPELHDLKVFRLGREKKGTPQRPADGSLYGSSARKLDAYTSAFE